MLFRQVIHEDLGCASYLVGDPSAGLSAVIDPQWEIEPYLRLARLHGVRIAHVLETHNHADHVSGHGRLAEATGATIHIHEEAEAEYPHEPFTDGWSLRLGELEVEAAHTPGHRPEHTAFLLRDRSRGGEPVAALTGDSLFVGEVARPDLAIDPADGATDLYRSLSRLFELPATVEVWPGHLGGSMCGGAGLDDKASSTIGFEQEHNRFSRIDSVEDFVAATTQSLGDPPPNAEHVVALNRGRLRGEPEAPAPLSPQALEAAIAGGAAVVDARTNERFDEGHVPGAISVSASDTGFATKVAQVIDPGSELIVIAADDSDGLAAAGLLASVGLTVDGFLADGMAAWVSAGRPVEVVETVSAGNLSELASDGSTVILDVRDEDEYAAGHLEGSLNIPYAQLPERAGELPRDRPIATVCSGGKRSGLAASILQREGFAEVVHVTGRGV